MPTARESKADIHDTIVDNVFAQRADDGSIAHALVAGVGPLSEHNQLDLSILHGNGTNTVAQKMWRWHGLLGSHTSKGRKRVFKDAMRA